MSLILIQCSTLILDERIRCERDGRVRTHAQEMELLVDGIRPVERTLSECVELLFGETKFVGQALQLVVAFFELGQLIIERFQCVFDRLAEREG